VKIRADALAALVEHARQEAPLECCGLLIGRDDVVDECIRTRNIRSSDVTYRVEPADHFAAVKRVRREGRTILGAYHSHPRTPAVPSPTDLAEAHYDDFLYVIVSLSADCPDVRGYRLDRGDFVAVPLIAVT
jgi:[CysO sulfur-carrier protein]-S-L-cysteine hydrolase